jgi:NAD-dependent SIR2 family protein deacetylase
MKFEEKLKCTKCQVAMKKIGVRFKNLKAREVHKCPTCGKRKTKEEENV